MGATDDILKCIHPTLHEACEPLVAAALTAFPDVAKCEPQTVAPHILYVQQTGLIIGHEVALTARLNRRENRTECGRLVMFGGLIRMAMSDKRVTRITVGIVYENEETEGRFSVDALAEPPISHRPILLSSKRGAPLGAYATGMVDSQWHGHAWLDRDELAAHAAKFGGPIWRDANPQVLGELWKKTALRRWLKNVPKSPLIHAALALDDADIDAELEEATRPPAQSPTERARVVTASAPAPNAPPTADPARAVTATRKGIGEEVARLWPALASLPREAAEPVRAALVAFGDRKIADVAVLLGAMNDEERRVTLRDELGVDIDAIVTTELADINEQPSMFD